jgi:O-antigen ligase
MIYLVVVGWLLSPTLVLLLIVPPLAVLAQREFLDPILTQGAVDVRPSDFLLVVVATRVLFDLLVRRARPRGYAPVALFVSAMGLSTFCAIYISADSGFRSELFALTRLVAEASVVFIMANTLRSRTDFRWFLRCWRVLGLLFAASVLADIVLQPFGLTFGEVQYGDLTTRYLGSVGDSVSFILPLFLFTSFLAGRHMEAAFLGVALLATGTRGALLTIAVGLIVIVARQRGFETRRRLLGGALVAAVLVGVFASDFGGLRTRLVDSRILGEGMYQRSTSYSLALEVIRENPFLGVGFTGFTIAAPRHRAPSFVTGTYNQWLQVLTDGGLIGLLAFAAFIVSALGTMNRAASIGSGTPIAIVLSGGSAWLWGLVLGNQTAAWLLPGSLIAYLVWCLLGLAVARLAIERARRKSSLRADIPVETDHSAPATEDSETGWPIAAS